MRNESSTFRLAVCALCFLSLFGFRAYSQDQDKDRKNGHPDGIVQDWSWHHVVYPRIGPIQSLIAAQHDRRAIISWQEAEREDWHRERRRRHHRDHDHDGDDIVSDLHEDWAISLGTGSVAPAMYPAKFGFDPNALPSCPNDFVVFPVNVAGLPVVVATGNITNSSINVTITAGIITPSYVGKPIAGGGIPAGDTIASITGNPATSITLAVAASATTTGDTLTVSGQPNIVAFNHLYSGTAGGAGICNRTPSGTDTGVAAETLWSYDISAAGGLVATSPSLSIDGTKVAFVETVAGTSAHFHVLVGGSGDGVDATNLQNVLLPVAITSFTASTPTAGQATDLSFGSTGDTLSSPFVDYSKDVAYVGNDAGVLFRIKNVFCTTAGCGGAAPSLDTGWNSTGSVTIGGTCAGPSGKLTGPVVEFTSGNVFAGCADGKLYGFTSTGSPLTNSPLTVGNGGATGGIVDPPLVDVVNKFVYVVSGNNGTNSVLVQAASDFSSSVTAILGQGGDFNLHLPYFNEAYRTSAFNGAVANVQGTTGSNTTTGSTSNWQIYEWADSGVAGSSATLYGVGFNNLHVMTAGPASNFLRVVGSPGVEFSPLTEFLNGSVDQLYASGLTTLTPSFIEYNLTDFAGLFPNVLFPINSANAVGGSRSEGHGTTGIVVDNVSPDVQASSVYFGIPSLNTAVKLTQSGLQ